MSEGRHKSPVARDGADGLGHRGAAASGREGVRRRHQLRQPRKERSAPGPGSGERGARKWDRDRRVMMREQWNAEFYTPLKEKEEPEDMYVYKNRISGFWGGPKVEETLREKVIRTLLFSGANTDQWVAASLVEAFNKGWDCLLLSDACETWSPEFAKRCIKYNCEIGWGFILSCKDLVEGVENMQESSHNAER